MNYAVRLAPGRSGAERKRPQAGLSSLCIAMLCLPGVAGAVPILAEFSRTANSIADDGVGPAPAPLQVVNNSDRTGPVETLLTDGVVPGPNYAQAYTNVGFGHIRVIATAQSQDGVQKSATADGGLQDVLRFVGVGTVGDTYRLSGAFSVAGTTSYPASDPLALSVINASYHWNAYQNEIAIGGAAANFTRNSSGLDFEGVDFLGSIIPVTFDFVWGQPVIIELGLGAGVGANSFDPSLFAAASVDMGNSLVWLGASIASIDGQLVDARIESLSGTDWNRAASVPEPGTLLLMLFGLGLGLAA
jgi:PEP-CTERM motif